RPIHLALLVPLSSCTLPAATSPIPLSLTTLFRSPQLRRSGDRTGSPPRSVPEPAGQRRFRDRGGHGDQHGPAQPRRSDRGGPEADRKSTRLNSSHVKISYAVFCSKKKKKGRDVEC